MLYLRCKQLFIFTNLFKIVNKMQKYLHFWNTEPQYVSIFIGMSNVMSVIMPYISSFPICLGKIYEVIKMDFLSCLEEKISSMVPWE